MIRPAPRAWQAAAFSLTGVGIALLGAVLPAILRRWQLTDSRGGLLLLAAWGGSTSGALLVRERPQRTAFLGLWLAALGLLVIPGAPGWALPFLFLLYGTGLGMTMTAVSTLRARAVPTAEIDTELNRFNLLWAAGALAAPLAAAKPLQGLGLPLLFRLLALAFVASGCALWWSTVQGPAWADRNSAATASPDAVAASTASLAPRTWAPIRFCVFAAAAVGLESAVGSWIATYTQRSSAGVSFAAVANAALWGGLLLSRGTHSLPGQRWLRTRASRWLHLGAVGLGVLLLVAPPSAPSLGLAGLLCGVGLGPLYPYVLSLALPRFRSDAVFVMAGVGASVLPWLTGVLSTASHSLRVGLLVPVLGLVLLGASAMRLRSDQAF